MPKLRMYGNTENLYSYFRPTPDRDRILLGSRSFDRQEPSQRSVVYLQKKLTKIFPELGSSKVDYCWLGNVAFTKSQLPTVFENNNIKNCNQIATHGIHKPIHCENHKTDNDVDLVERKCTKCGSIDIIINYFCSIYYFILFNGV